ncbi:diguanylate cyclase [Maritimibacter sp. 55A14]|uniref:putative bifunctional diguanylate cyclase/phosphodiesterase n=1 Tax=Maritimibacter sp. 55A14 TaxID=2174844 RepID=UPI000D622DD4|nr:EAL domain-containing protein [Maritimibacter sp. 55A14]PWE32735.1 diguanylate cyclase [Maritimibacter sp. 55A14]
MPDTPQGTRLHGLCRRLGELHLISFLPLFALIAYWTRVEVVLFVISFMFPLLIALQELVRPRGASAAPAADAPDHAPAAEGRDALTGLMMRQDAMRHLDRFLEEERSTGRVTAVLLVDIDGLRRLNERQGMAAGDSVLRATAGRLRGALRDADIVARIDGNRFAAILSPVRRADFESVLALAERIRDAVAEPVSHDMSSVYASCSIGICLVGRAPENSAASMLQAAEAALDEARRSGAAAIRSFSPRMRRETRKNNGLSSDLDAALENGQIRPWFQPQVCTDTGTVTGFEALARWIHPDEGVLLPGTFLKAVNDAGRSERLGEVILYHALSALRSWDRTGLHVPTVSVNFSTEELREPKLCEKIRWEVDRFDLDPARVVIEILETVMAGGASDTITRNIRALSAMGVGIDLDDFGTGQASIANIRRFGVGRIKIDRSFVTNVDRDREQQVMISAILSMADSLEIETLAEGVEKIAEQAMLAQLGCRYIQGFGLARPMRFEDTIAWLHNHAEKLAGTASLGRRTG